MIHIIHTCTLPFLVVLSATGMFICTEKTKLRKLIVASHAMSSARDIFSKCTHSKYLQAYMEPYFTSLYMHTEMRSMYVAATDR